MTNAIRKEAPDFVIFLGDGEADFAFRWRDCSLSEYGEIIIYQAEDGLAEIDARVADGTV